jgi:hypothetical protein
MFSYATKANTTRVRRAWFEPNRAIRHAPVMPSVSWRNQLSGSYSNLLPLKFSPRSIGICLQPGWERDVPKELILAVEEATGIRDCMD